MASVRLHSVRKQYDKNPTATIENLNLEIQDGEFMVLVGPSGCGKSTTLRMVAGLEEASGGDIFIGDRRVNDMAPKDRDIAMVFQNYALYPHMSVRENLAFGLKLRKFPKAEIAMRVDEAAELLEITEFLDRKPKALSGGQRQRVALGRAIVRKPTVFLFDEPLSNLDAKLRVQMRTEIKKLHLRLNTTMIYVTHDQVEAMTMGDRITVMKAGVIHQVDTPLHLYHRPADLFVAGFIGNPAMNLLPVRIEAGDSPMLVLGTAQVPLPDHWRAALSSAVGQDLLLGVRPEHLHLESSRCAQPLPLPVLHDVSELLGNESFLHARWDRTELTARTPDPVHLSMGAALTLYLDLSLAHLFDPRTERRLG